MEGAEKPDRKISVLVAEDEALIRRAFCLLVQSLEGIILAGEAENGALAVDQAGRCRPDIVLMDLAMPVMDGIEAAIRIREISPQTRIIALTGLRTPSEILRGLRVGISGILLKSTTPEELRQAVQAVIRGERYVSPQVAALLGEEYMDLRRREESPLAELSPRETQIVELLSSGQRSKQIAEELKISEKTVDKHCENARRKLHSATTAELVGIWNRLTKNGRGKAVRR